MGITTAQIRGARGILNWSQSDLAEHTGISATSIGSIENGQTSPRTSTLNTIQKAFEEAGIEFIDGGVRQKNELIYMIEGPDALDQLLDDIYKTLFETGGEVSIFGLEERSDPNSEEYKKVVNHLDRLTKANITERILLKHGDMEFLAPVHYYRWIDKDYFSPHPFIIYGNKLAMINWGKTATVFVIESPLFASTFRKVFDFMWDRADKPDIQAKSKASNA